MYKMRQWRNIAKLSRENFCDSRKRFSTLHLGVERRCGVENSRKRFEKPI
eukprot:TRINITY_DN13445_c0_g1_i1.p1 TRINITY_DN13445_c0_g1~~TRINITY_DN13445_c0_g1_i1.p1  ORF type:complete len:50 (+),score=8.77 TRINITY_DN13445_c0_g1_i1:137-286(+)